MIWHKLDPHLMFLSLTQMRKGEDMKLDISERQVCDPFGSLLSNPAALVEAQ